MQSGSWECGEYNVEDGGGDGEVVGWGGVVVGGSGLCGLGEFRGGGGGHGWW